MFGVKARLIGATVNQQDMAVVAFECDESIMMAQLEARMFARQRFNQADIKTTLTSPWVIHDQYGQYIRSFGQRLNKRGRFIKAGYAHYPLPLIRVLAVLRRGWKIRFRVAAEVLLDAFVHHSDLV